MGPAGCRTPPEAQTGSWFRGVSWQGAVKTPDFAITVLTEQQIGWSESAAFFTSAFFENHPSVYC
jgi:hypothetical protein